MRQSNVFFRAWAIRKQNSKLSFAKSLKLAWNVEQLKMKMEGGNEVEFVYVKLDGSIRIAKGTLPEVSKDFLSQKNNSVAQNSVVKYYDIEKEGWRSFKATNCVHLETF